MDIDRGHHKSYVHGKNPVDRNADVTVVKDDEEITITNNVTADEYFKVRAT
jgi:hypothetical protein